MPTMSLPSRVLRPVVVPLAIVAAVAIAGCGSGSSPDDTPSAAVGVTATGQPATSVDDAADRIVAIEVARTAAEPAVAELTAASGTLVALFEAWEVEPGGIDLAAQVADQQERVDAAVGAARSALDEDASADVAAAHAALGLAADLVADQQATATGVAAEAALVDRVADLGAGFVRQVNQPGSRSIQRNAMNDMIAEFDRALADLGDATTDAACPAALPPRIEAVTHMSEVAGDLAAMATNGQGDAFDALRAEATRDPFGLGTTDLDTIAAMTDCDAVAAVTGVRPLLGAALADVQDTLNPADLVDP